METSHNKRFSEMSVGVEAAVPPRPRPLAIVWVNARPIRHFAKPPGVI